MHSMCKWNARSNCRSHYLLACNRCIVRYKSLPKYGIVAAAPVIDKIVKEYKEDENAQLIDLMLTGWAELEKQGLGAWATVHASKTLTFPRNRGKRNVGDQPRG